ncbi:hypothetical protein HPB50_014873 [Hyalomma asiaticum]|uniref:Uncharacterized protein n=1 Tax=Hyalomma asiaticum TaxID=266040 RepID=A0ACB7SQ90_HYAAI|nr:hypothetical protein HPB50_014873 [Hyalomma asiaticum]
MATSAFQLRGYDPEVMAWTSIPTTGDTTSMILSQIRSQALHKAAERRFQNKANRTASGDGPAAVSLVGNVNAPATRATGFKGKASKKWKPRPMHKPASNDYIIVIKPRERTCLHEAFTETGYAADRLIGDFVVNTEKRKVLLQGYLIQDGGNTCQGVIVVRNTDTTETLQHRVCWRAGTIEKPRYVHYDMVVPVRNYYKTIPPCGLCGAVGHRAHACPNLQPNTCRLCGLHASLVEGARAPHYCVHRCSVCSDTHANNSRDCAAKFRTPKTAARKGGKKKMAPKKKSRHPGLPSDQPCREPSKTDKPAPPPGGRNRLSTVSPPQGGPEKPTAEKRGRTGVWVTAVEDRHQVSGSGGAASPSPFSPAGRVAPSKLRQQHSGPKTRCCLIIALESKINQIPPSPSIPAAEVIESSPVLTNTYPAALLNLLGEPQRPKMTTAAPCPVSRTSPSPRVLAPE